MSLKNCSVSVDTVLPHVNYQNLGEAMAWLTLPGAKRPKPFHAGWRLFNTQQHGDNYTWEILSKSTDDNEENDD
jgi:hypothetical protein